MKISRKGEYGLAAIVYLAGQPRGSLSLRGEIARRCGIPPTFLAQILARLRSRGILGSVRGKKGGYYLKSEPAGLSLADVLEALDGPITLVRQIKEGDSPDAQFVNVVLSAYFSRLQSRGYELLKSLKIADMLSAPEEKPGTNSWL